MGHQLDHPVGCTSKFILTLPDPLLPIREDLEARHQASLDWTVCLPKVVWG